MGRRRRGREVSGILLLDKPEGMTSNQVLQRVKRLYQADKAGHTGALDPLATGLLPICLGEATKFSQFLLDADKRYQAVARLGVRTDTSDAQGEVVARAPVQGVTAEAVETLLHRAFSGEITQTPSAFSALKHRGQPLYKLARQGLEVPAKTRQVRIHEISLDFLRGEDLGLDVSCSKGTYIRTLVEDLGQELGCGAHVTALRRLEAGPFAAASMHSLDAIESAGEEGFEALDALLWPPWAALEHMPRLALTPAEQQRITRGQPVELAETLCGHLLLFAQVQDVFLGLGEACADGLVRPRRLIRNAGH